MIQNNDILTAEYHVVNKAMTRTNELKIIKGKLKLLLSSKALILPNLNEAG